MPRDLTDQQLEETGFTTLDLTKHTANAIIQALDGRDRLAIVTFGSFCQTILPLQPMLEHGKELARKRINDLEANGTTCLWGGIREGLNQFRDDDDVGNVRAMMVLTDGQPFGVGAFPSGGWLSGMQNQGKLLAAIHTFGFGYDLEEGLLPTIAGLGGGSYSFISDIGMVGTAIIHATANLQSTFARKAVLSLTMPRDVGLEESWLDIGRLPTEVLSDGRTRYTVDLKTIRYGQPLHRYFRYVCNPETLSAALRKREDLVVEATLEFHNGKQIRQVSARVRLGPDADVDMDRDASLSAGDIAYHLSRTQLATFLSTLFPLDHKTGMYKPVNALKLPNYKNKLKNILQNLPAVQDAYRCDRRNMALVEDFRMPDGAGAKAEVEQALIDDAWDKWGKHFLPSLLFAYVHEMRMSFKDPGTQVFGGALFQSLVDVLSTAFDTLPPPRVISPGVSDMTTTSTRTMIMSELNRPNGACFAGDTRVLLASSPAGRTTVAIRDLRAGAMVQTLKSPGMVQAVVKCGGGVEDRITMCDLPVMAEEGGRLRITPWHPISLDQGATWQFPATVAERENGPLVQVSGEEGVYSVLLRRDGGDDHPNRHSINVDGVWGVTMGHGLTESGEAAWAEDVRNHPFYRNHDAVIASLNAMPKGPDGMFLIASSGGKRDETTMLVNGFTAFMPARSAK